MVKAPLWESPVEEDKADAKVDEGHYKLAEEAINLELRCDEEP